MTAVAGVVASSAHAAPACGEPSPDIASNQPKAVLACPPIVIDSVMHEALPASFWPQKITGVALGSVSRLFAQSSCVNGFTPITAGFGEHDYDLYRLRNGRTGGPLVCVQFTLAVQDPLSDYMVRANSPEFVFDHVDDGWIGDPGFGSMSSTQPTQFSANLSSGQRFDVLVFDMNAPGLPRSYVLTISDDTCALRTLFAHSFE